VTTLLVAAVYLVAIVGGVAYVLSAGTRRRARRRAFADRPFPDEWVRILEGNLPPYRKLPEKLRQELHREINMFLGEKSFEGCGGLTVTDEIKVTIAAQACVLLLGHPDRGYPRLRSVLVYPSTYVAGDGQGGESVRLGESWNGGAVVLAWSSVKQGAFNFHDGHNVTMHEFAHQLDQEDGVADGAPILERRSAYSSWAKVFAREFAVLQKKTGEGKRSVLDAYGATDPAEFFAVATEAFFEKPKQLAKKHPELYEELRSFYGTEPRDWG
jgi:Mlc titration factor MtfA (ptsG expression regulator)